MPGTLILNHTQIQQKIARMAAEIYENYFNSHEIILAGIEGNGFRLAVLLKNELEKLGAAFVRLIEIKIDKRKPSMKTTELSFDGDLTGKRIILVDDVLNTGRTFSYALAALLSKGVEGISSVVLVNRSYKNFPVHANFVGLSLTTTLENHVSVDLTENNYAAYLL